LHISVVDYGLGNLLSVARALEACGARCEMVGTASDLEKADKLLLPGVGAFPSGMEGLRALDLVEPLRDYAASGRPLLGICLGMQLLMDVSHEFGVHEGLGLIGGSVRPVERIAVDGSPLKTPHIGWSQLSKPAGCTSWRGSLLENLDENSHAYFVHSYAVVPDDDGSRIAECEYGGQRITAAVRRNNVHGLQFHPEKSGEVGLRILTTFIQS